MTSRSPFSFRARLRSFRYALRGVRLTLAGQHNAWVHAVVSIAVIVAGFLLGLSHLEWCVIVLAMMAVWTAEALNTAIEHLCDLVSPDAHPLIEKAKDAAAGAVLISAAGSVVVGLLIFGSHLLGRHL